MFYFFGQINESEFYFMRKKTLKKFAHYVDPAEMAEIKSNKKLLKRLNRGFKDAKAMRGKFAEGNLNAT